MHYHRWYRHGDPLFTMNGQPKPDCKVDGCLEPADSLGWCKPHYDRWRRCGDPTWVFELRDDVGYTAAHDRVRRRLGRPRNHRCVDCGGQAAHWSYDHSDPKERFFTARGGYLIPYSVDPERYRPMCVSCHKRHDLHALAVRRKGNRPA